MVVVEPKFEYNYVNYNDCFFIYVIIFFDVASEKPTINFIKSK
jgi:hypothetical protein